MLKLKIHLWRKIHFSREFRHHSIFALAGRAFYHLCVSFSRYDYEAQIAELEAQDQEEAEASFETIDELLEFYGLDTKKV